VDDDGTQKPYPVIEDIRGHPFLKTSSPSLAGR